MQKLAGIKDPELTVKNVALQDINFDTATLLFDINVYNPNNVKAVVPGFTYDLTIDDKPIVNGKQDEGFTVGKKGTSMIQVPVTLSYKTIYSVLQSVAEKDTFDYRMLVNMNFDLPVIGTTVVPVTYEDTLPVLRMPDISVDSLKLNSLTLTGANLDLRLKVNNPNALDLRLDNLNYTFNVNGQNWAKGVSVTPLELYQKKETTLNIPMTLNFITMGKTVYTSLSESAPLNYDLTGSCDLVSSLLKTARPVNLPIRRSGQVRLVR
jgi:LEA14-like dessication related protein